MVPDAYAQMHADAHLGLSLAANLKLLHAGGDGGHHGIEGPAQNYRRDTQQVTMERRESANRRLDSQSTQR
jgi:hypothetical protein